MTAELGLAGLGAAAFALAGILRHFGWQEVAQIYAVVGLGVFATLLVVLLL